LKSINRAALWRWVRIGVAVVLILLLLPTFLQPEFIDALRGVNLPLLTLALLLSVASVASKAWRWGIVLRWRGIVLSPQYLLLSYFISMFFNNFLPSGMGGDAVRAYESARDTGRAKESITAVILERGSGMLSLFAAGSLSLLLFPAHELPLPVVLLVHGLFVGAIIGILLLWQDFTGNVLTWIGAKLPGKLAGVWSKIVGVYEDFKGYRTQYRLLFDLMVQSVVTLILTIASLYALLLALGQTVSPGAFAGVVAIATAIDLIPISPNGLGVREGVYVFLLGNLGIGTATALAFGILIRLLVLIQALIGGVAFLLRGARPRPVPVSDKS
jgi:glycosyltransferase 2 family protein